MFNFDIPLTHTGTDAAATCVGFQLRLGAAVLLGLLVGLSLGLLGGGGSVLTVPVLVYALGYDAKAAIAMSLLVAGLSAFVSGRREAVRRERGGSGVTGG